jgi:hypothetical protein
MKLFDSFKRRSGKDRRKRNKAAPNMDKRSGKERRSGVDRREIPRLSLHTSCPTSFKYKGLFRQGVMVNLSAKGAKFRMLESKVTLDFDIGQELELDILTPFGASSFKGVVIWTDMVKGYFTWGVLISEMPQNLNDPLQSLLESPFQEP